MYNWATKFSFSGLLFGLKNFSFDILGPEKNGLKIDWRKGERKKKNVYSKVESILL